MTPEERFRSFAAQLTDFRYRGDEQLFDFISNMRRAALGHANELSRRAEPSHNVQPSLVDKYMGRRQRPGILEVNGRVVVVEKRSSFR